MANTKRLGGLRYDLQLGIAQFQKNSKEAISEFQKMRGSLQTVATGMKAAFAGLGIALAINQIKSFGSAIVDLANKGEQAGSIKESFEALGGSESVIDEARKRVVGLVGAFDLMQAANRGLIAQIPGFQEGFANVVDLAGRLANALGKDTKAQVEELTEAIVKGNAKALRPLGFHFTDVKDKAKVTQEALAQVASVMEKLPPVGDSVANSLTSLNNTWDDVTAKVGIQLNNNTDLIASLRRLEQTIQDIDWGEFGDNLAQIATFFVDLANRAIPIAIAAINQFADDMLRVSLLWKNLRDGGQGNLFDAVDKQFSIIKEQHKLESATDKVNEFARAVNGMFNAFKGGSKPSKDAVDKLLAQAERVGDAVKNAGGPDAIGLRGGLTMVAKQLHILKENAVAAKKVGVELGGGIDKATAKAEKLQDKFQNLLGKSEADAIKDRLEEAIESGNRNGVDTLMPLYRDAIGKVADAQLEELSKHNPELAARYREAMINDAIDPMVKREEEERRRAHEAGVQNFKNLFSSLISGQGLDWKEMLTDVALSFAAEMAQSLVEKIGGGFLEGLFDGEAIGQSLGESLADGIQSAIIDAWTGVPGSGDSAQGILDPITDAIGGIFSGAGDFLGGLNPFARGGVFDGPITEKAASGRIIDRPMLFKHGRGLGLMGEAGPEAILPLTRVNGQLGVHATGSGRGGPREITIVVNAPGAEPGAEARILAALHSSVEQITEGIIDAMAA